MVAAGLAVDRSSSLPHPHFTLTTFYAYLPEKPYSIRSMPTIIKMMLTAGGMPSANATIKKPVILLPPLRILRCRESEPLSAGWKVMLMVMNHKGQDSQPTYQRHN